MRTIEVPYGIYLSAKLLAATNGKPTKVRLDSKTIATVHDDGSVEFSS